MGADRVLIVGVSTRALALSARDAGYECVSVDAFGDLDQKERVVNVALGRDLGRAWSAATAVAVGRRFEVEGAAYLGNLENHPAAVRRRLARGRRLLGLAQGLAGDPAFGASGFRYCGSLHPFRAEARLLQRLDDVAQATTKAFGLVGANGIDFVVRDGEAFVLEVNGPPGAGLHAARGQGVLCSRGRRRVPAGSARRGGGRAGARDDAGPRRTTRPPGPPAVPQLRRRAGRPADLPAREVIAELMRRPHLSADVGQVLFGPATVMTADQPAAEMLHDLLGRKWVAADLELERGCGIVPFEYRETNVVHATQFAAGLELLLLSPGPLPSGAPAEGRAGSYAARRSGSH